MLMDLISNCIFVIHVIGMCATFATETGDILVILILVRAVIYAGLMEISKSALFVVNISAIKIVARLIRTYVKIVLHNKTNLTIAMKHCEDSQALSGVT